MIGAATSQAPAPAQDPPPTLSPELEALLEETLMPNTGSVEFQRNPLTDYLGRMMRLTPHEAETFLANSRITPASQVNAPADEQAIEATRAWMHATAFRPHEDEIDFAAAAVARVRLPLAALDSPAAAVIAALVADPRALELLYALELLAVIGEEVFRVAPTSDAAWLVSRMSTAERAQLGGAVLGPRGPAPARQFDLLAIVAVPWRHMLFQGPRGLRRTLSDDGRLQARLELAASSAAVTAAIERDFVDDVVDRALDLDGAERTTLTLMRIAKETR